MTKCTYIITVYIVSYNYPIFHAHTFGYRSGCMCWSVRMARQFQAVEKATLKYEELRLAGEIWHKKQNKTNLANLRTKPLSYLQQPPKTYIPPPTLTYVPFFLRSLGAVPIFAKQKDAFVIYISNTSWTKEHSRKWDENGYCVQERSKSNPQRVNV